MTASTRRELRSAATSTSTTAIGLIRALTDARPIKPTSTRCLSARRPNLGRASTYRRGNSVQTTAATSPEAKDLEAQLAKTGIWYFRRKQRLDPKQSEFPSLDDWLSFVRSDEGVRKAGGGITRYLFADEIDAIDLVEEVRQMARIFRPLMEHVVADAPPTTAPEPTAPTPLITPGANEDLPSFGDLLRAFLREFTEARRGPFQKTESLWNAMSDVKTRLEK